ncbi:MAG: nicotinate-nucleotide adenylyltransferase [Bacteroidota bacterium]
MKKRIGIIGGTFNPPHIAHLIIAERFAEQMRLDECCFVPAALSPFKTEMDPASFATPEHRLKMVELAIAKNPVFKTDDVELVKGGVSYSIDTISHFKNSFPESDLFLLIGTDQAVDFTKWKAWGEILKVVQLCIVRRPEALKGKTELEITEELTSDFKIPEWIDAPLMEISATEIRERVLHKKSIRFVVPREVEEYIFKNNLYAGKS